MKVTTLACIQGAWLPNFSPLKTLDIGAGSGLLTLMVAQHYNCTIDAVEIDREAFGQLTENIKNSPWKKRIKCYQDDISSFSTHCNTKYEFIISNPPFFSNQLRSGNNKKNLARHDTGLTIDSLLYSTLPLLSTGGKISLLLPPFETDKLMNACADFEFFVSDQLVIFDSPKKDAKAIVSYLSKEKTRLCINKIFIKKETGEYSSSFVNLMKDYYLYL